MGFPPADTQEPETQGDVLHHPTIWAADVPHGQREPLIPHGTGTLIESLDPMISYTRSYTDRRCSPEDSRERIFRAASLVVGEAGFGVRTARHAGPASPFLEAA